MANAQISTSVTIISSLLGYQAISLTNTGTSAESLIAGGSKVEIAGAFFNFTSDETPQASTWTAIGTGSTAFITLTPSGTAGSQILTARYSGTAPEWSSTKQWWYASAASSVRYVAQVYKQGASDYAQPVVMEARRRVIYIGAWNMDSTSQLDVAHGLDVGKVRSVASVSIVSDGDVNSPLPIDYSAVGGAVQGTFYLNGADDVRLYREIGGFFDSASFNATDINRGWITLWYEP